MKSLIYTSSLLAACVGISLAASAQTQSSQASSQDKKFIEKAAEGNFAEVELGKLGAEKSQNSQLKQFCQDLQSDHQSANQKLQPIAQADGVQIPQTLDSKHQREINRLQKMSGAEFDKEFATTALRQHAQTIEAFQKEAQQGQDPTVKQYAQSMLPGLEHHLQMAKDTASSVGVSQGTISSILNRYPEAVGGGSTPQGQQQGGSTKAKTGGY